MAGRPHTSTLLEARADCQRCTWTAASKNAQALAARHFDNKGHQVRVTTKTEIIYGRAGEKGRSATKQEKFL